MNKALVFSFIVSTIFISSIGTLFNISYYKTYGFLLITILFFYKILSNEKSSKLGKETNQLLILCMVVVFIKFFINQNPFSISEILFFPIISYNVLSTTNFKTKQIIKIVIISFFTLNGVLSMLEFAFKFNFFSFDLLIENNQIGEGFRSTALLGHPLNNALCMSIIMGFILCSTLNNFIKFFFIVIGLLSILAFNARGAFLIWILISASIFIFILFSHRVKKNYKILGIFAFLILILIVFYSLVNLHLGDRLLNDKIIDGSAETRINLLNSFDGLNGLDFLFGNDNALNELLTKQKNGGFENSIVILIYSYGFPISILIIYFFSKWIYLIIKELDFLKKAIIIISFVVVGNLNNGFFLLPPLYFFAISTVFISKNKNFKLLKR